MSHQSALQYFELADERRVIREIADLLVRVCIDIYLVLSSLRNAPRYRHLQQEIFSLAFSIEPWLDNLCDVIDNTSFLAIIYEYLVEPSSANSRGMKKYIGASLRRTQSQRSLHQTMKGRMWELGLVLDEFNNRLDALTCLVKETPEGTKIIASVETLNDNVERLLSMTGALLCRLSQRNSSFEAHLQTCLSKPPVALSDSKVQAIQSQCYNASFDLVGLREELKEQQQIVDWNLDRLSLPFDPMDVRASDYFDILHGTEFLEDTKKGGASAFINGRIVKLKQWFARVSGTKRIVRIDV